MKITEDCKSKKRSVIIYAALTVISFWLAVYFNSTMYKFPHGAMGFYYLKIAAIVSGCVCGFIFLRLTRDVIKNVKNKSREGLEKENDKNK